jgi:hypothetical protein
MPESLTIDMQKEILYFSTSKHPAKIESVNLDGTNRREILNGVDNPISKPTGMAVKDRRLYYLDPVFEKVVVVDSFDGSNEQVLLDNESGLRTLNIFQKRQSEYSPFASQP